MGILTYRFAQILGSTVQLLSHSGLACASALYQTTLHTRSNNLGTFSVGSHPFCPTMHSNPTYTSRCNKYAECVIYSCESRTNLTISTYNVRSSRSSGRYMINADCRHAVDMIFPLWIEISRMVLGRRVVGILIHTPDPHTTVICRRMHHNGHL